MKKRRSDDLRPEYDLTQLKGSVRGKYYKQAAAGTNLVLLEPDVAQAFPDSSSVNRALRLTRSYSRRECPKRRGAQRGHAESQRARRLPLAPRRLTRR